MVEDDPAVAKVLTSMLQSLNFSVEHYKESAEVMKRMNDKSMPDFDLGILDVRLGDIDGIELGHHLLNNQNVRNLLFISGDEPGGRIEQFDCNTVQFIRKPISLLLLKNSIEELMLMK